MKQLSEHTLSQRKLARIAIVDYFGEAARKENIKVLEKEVLKSHPVGVARRIKLNLKDRDYALALPLREPSLFHVAL